MSSLWEKLNYLVPMPQCRTRGDEVTEWMDSRAQPTDVELNAVQSTDIQERKKDSDAEKLGDTRLAVTALAEIIYENPDIQAAFSTPREFKSAVGARYRRKLDT